MITVIGLIVTIVYTTSQYKDQDRKRIQPYLTVKQLYKTSYRDEVASLTNDDYKMGIVALYSESKTNEDDIFLKDLELYGEMLNIGIGTAINININNIHVENRVFEHSTNYLHSLLNEASENTEASPMGFVIPFHPLVSRQTWQLGGEQELNKNKTMLPRK